MKDQKGFSYGTEIEWTGERGGRLSASNLPPLDVSPPPEFQGKEGAWTPEHLYIASVNACFMTTFLAIAANSKLDVVSLGVSAEGKLEKIEAGGFQITEIVLKPRLVIRASRDLDRAARIVQKAEKNCFISNSIKTIVKLEPQIYHEQSPAYPCPTIPET